MASTSDKEDVQICFTTKQAQYAVPDYTLLVQSSIDTNGLNTLVYELLKESNVKQSKIQFDFIIASELLRTSLLEHIAKKNVATEDIIEVQYVEKYPPPEHKNCITQDDWISAVAVYGKWILTGSYDNTLHIWTTKGEHLLVIRGHEAAVKAVAWLSVYDDEASFVSASADQTAMIWQWNIEKNSVKCVHVCEEHKRGLLAVGANPDKSLIATGGWDTMLKIWSTSMQDETEDGESASKMIKAKQSKTKLPQCTLMGNIETITGIVWSDKTTIITSSWDHTLRIWDSELRGIKDECLGNEPFLDVDYSPLTRTIIAPSSDNFIKLFDPRSSESMYPKTVFKSHTQWAQCVRWSTVNEYLFVSGGYDDLVKLWDTRSPTMPLYDLRGHTDKVLCCDWSESKLIMSGGADNTLEIFKTEAR
ncbi:PREDICTED: ribosome biogenesis protein WDR12 homolog [Dinoponera quadriceps]|uniref:Ribosome biogenesis protein WDR12 homolog n=1 Tax=Dinoponera quadriceps TaxID=609295 RepID=A0A6P3YGQ3_DINQU|nr:PREDICTED: ribosome biogenesis protein WDR12 homolog [Dinoponera quadriceps]